MCRFERPFQRLCVEFEDRTAYRHYEWPLRTYLMHKLQPHFWFDGDELVGLDGQGMGHLRKERAG